MKAPPTRRKGAGWMLHMGEQTTSEMGLPTLRTLLARRVAYRETLGAGLAVTEMSDQNARMEMRFLVAEVQAIPRSH